MTVHFLEEEAETTEAMVPAIVETDESGQGGAEKIPETDDIFTQLILQANHEAHRVEAVLQVEDKSNNIANLQGFCAGIRDFKSVANDAGFNIIPALFDTANRMTPWIVVIDNGDEEEGGDHECELDLDTLTTFSSMLDELTHSPEYITLRDKMTERIKAKKISFTPKPNAGVICSGSMAGIKVSTGWRNRLRNSTIGRKSNSRKLNGGQGKRLPSFLLMKILRTKSKQK